MTGSKAWTSRFFLAISDIVADIALSLEKPCVKALAEWANDATMIMLFSALMSGCAMSNLNVFANRGKNYNPYSAIRSYLLTALAVAGILALRLSMVVKASSLVWEDGSIFLTGALSGSLWQNMLTPYAGYYHLIPRLVAQYATVYNLPSVPVFYITSSIVFASLMLALPVLPVFSGLMSLRWRIVLALLCALIPAFTEVFGNIAHLHWFALWGLTLFSFADLSKISARWLVVAIPLLFASAYSSAPAFVLIPLYGLQVYRFRSNWVATVFSLTFILFASSYISVCARLKEASSFSSLSLSEIAVYTSKTVGFKSILIPLIGQRFSSVLQIFWLSIAAFIFASILLLVAAWRSCRSSRYGDSYRYLAQCYSIVAFVAIVPIMRPVYVNHFLAQGY